MGMNCLKDPTCGIFLKRGLLKDIKNYHCGRSGRVTHTMMWSLDSVISTLLIFVDKSQKKFSTNPKKIVDKSKNFCRQIQKFLSTNPKKSSTNPKKMEKSKNPEIQNIL